MSPPAMLLTAATGGGRYSYARSLVRLAELSLRKGPGPHRARPAVLAAADRPSQLRRRIVRLFEGTPHEKTRLLRDWPMALILAAALLAATSLFVSAKAKPAAPTEKAAPPPAKPAAEAALDARIARLIDQLGSEDFKAREAAQNEIDRLKQELVKRGERPDVRIRKDDSDEVKDIRKELRIWRNRLREDIWPSHARSRRNYTEPFVG